MASLIYSKLGSVVVASCALLTADVAQAGPSRTSHKISPKLQKELDEADSYGRVALSHEDPQV